MSRRRRWPPWPPRRPRSLPLPIQLHQLLQRYPGSTGRLEPGRLLWTGVLTPCDEAGAYEVLIDHRLGGEPRVHVISPQLDGPGPLPHTYNGTRLCLYVPGQWADHLSIAATILPWTMEWLLFYELWSAGGGWQGGGVHPDDSHTRVPRISGRRHLAQLRYQRRNAVERERLLEGHRLVHAGQSRTDPQNLPGRRAGQPRAWDTTVAGREAA